MSSLFFFMNSFSVPKHSQDSLTTLASALGVFINLITTVYDLSRSFYAKVSDLHNELYKGTEAAMVNPLMAFTLIKRLHSEWLNVVYSNEALENAQGWLRAFFMDTSGVHD